MRKHYRFFVFLFFPIFLQAFLFDADLSPKAQRAKNALEGFDEVVQKALEDYRVPGVAVGLLVDGEVVYAKGFGFRDMESQLPVNTDTLFAVGSCTKAFTAFLMGTLVDQGIVRWDERVIDLLPEFRLWDQYATQNLTVRDLLTHRSGMPRHDFMWYNSAMTREEVIKRIRYLEPSTDIRERYQYNNLMYFTAGYAMEQVTGKSWEELVTQRILHPLDMHRTNFSVDEVQRDRNFAYPHLERNDHLRKIPFRNISLIGPAGSMNSCVSDLLHWVQLQLDGGIYDRQSLISPATLQEMHAPQVIVPGAPESKETLLYAYGIGWSVLSYRGHYYVSHDGGIDGFTSVVGFLPNERVGLVVLANKNLTTLPRCLSFELLDRVLEMPHIDWLAQGAEGIRKARETQRESQQKEDLLRKKNTRPSHDLEEYIGEYEHPGYGKVQVDLVDERLHITFNGITRILDHWHYDVFVLSEETQDQLVSLEGTKFTFHNNINGDIDELAIPFEPNTGEIVFKRKAGGSLSSTDYLRRFAGVYEIYGYTVEIAIRDSALCAVIPSQPIYELVPISENEFSVKSMTGYSVRFVLDGQGQVEEVLLVQPYGAFSARPKKVY